MALVSMAVGDFVSVRPEISEQEVLGTVKHVTYGRLECVLHHELEPCSAGYAMKQTSNEVTFDRFINSLNILISAQKKHGAVRAILGYMVPEFEEREAVEKEVKDVEALGALDESQYDAVMHALAAKQAACIHGPPGTGKTTAVAAFVMGEVVRGHRVLLTAPSNIAIDGLASKLVGRKGGVRLVRIGPPCRVSSRMLSHLPENIMKCVKPGKTVKDVLNHLAENEPTIVFENREDIFYTRRLAHESRVLREAQVVATTVAGAGSDTVKTAKRIFGGAFDIVVVDEAGQIPEAGIWTALLRGKKAVLAGDPKQLPPTVISDEALRYGLERSLLDRIFKNSITSRKFVKMLTIQYRMHATIAEWCSAQVYGGKLKSANWVRKRTLHDLPSVSTAHPDVMEPFIVLETGFCKDVEEVKDRGSYKNEKEVLLVKKHVDSLLRKGVRPVEIGVISPYKRQVETIRNAFREGKKRGIEVATVDSFQGREKEVVVISLVRTNIDGNIGFLRDNRRLNVAITRARRCVVVICDTSTVRTSNFIEKMLRYVTTNGDFRYAQL